MHFHWAFGVRIMSYRRRLKHIWSFPNFGEGGAAFVKLERVALRWVLVIWGRSKYQNSSNVFMWQRLFIFIGRLGSGSCPTDVASSTSDHFPILGKGELHLSNWKGSPWGEFWSSEDGQNIKIHPMYSFDNVILFSLDVWVTDHVLQTSPQAHLIISQFWGRGSCFCQTRKGRPEVSSGRLRTVKISKFIKCIHLTTLIHFHWTSGVRIMSYRRCLKHIWSFPNFWEGGAAFVKLERVALRWVLVIWVRSKYQNSSNVFIWQR
jgi:hypothetical protein